MRPEDCVWNKLERDDMHFFNFQNISSNLFSHAFFLIFGFGKDLNWKVAFQKHLIKLANAFSSGS